MPCIWRNSALQDRGRDERGNDEEAHSLRLAHSTAVITFAGGHCIGGSANDLGVASASLCLPTRRRLHPYGRFISSVAPRNDFGTLGDAVHAVQAGLVPDELYPNTCN